MTLNPLNWTITDVARFLHVTDYSQALSLNYLVLYIRSKEVWQTAQALALIADLPIYNQGYIGSIDRPYYLTIDRRNLTQWMRNLKKD